MGLWRLQSANNSTIHSKHYSMNDDSAACALRSLAGEQHAGWRTKVDEKDVPRTHPELPPAVDARLFGCKANARLGVAFTSGWWPLGEQLRPSFL